jgi:hypothetical protein
MSRFMIRADEEVRVVEVKDPTGWLLIALRPMESDTGQGEIEEG